MFLNGLGAGSEGLHNLLLSMLKLYFTLEFTTVLRLAKVGLGQESLLAVFTPEKIRDVSKS